MGKISEFGNPVWGHDDTPATDERKRGRREGLQEALRLMKSGATMTNNIQFQQGMDCVFDLLVRRFAEL